MSFTILFEPGLKPVIKHLQGQHDQRTHGSWAEQGSNFDENKDGPRTDMLYSVEFETNPISTEQLEALRIYSGNGFIEINKYLRSGMEGIEESFKDDIAKHLLHEKDLYTFADQADELMSQGMEVTKKWLEENAERLDVKLGTYNWEDKRGAGYQPYEEIKLAVQKVLVAEYVEQDFEGAQQSYFNWYFKPAGNGGLDNIVKQIDSVIERSPDDALADKKLYRVFSSSLVESLSPGDILTDKGFISTTLVDITSQAGKDLRRELGNIRSSNDIAGVILPSKGGTSKGLSLGYLRSALGNYVSVRPNEKEVLLPRDTSLEFIGTATGKTGEKIALFERKS